MSLIDLKYIKAISVYIHKKIVRLKFYLLYQWYIYKIFSEYLETSYTLSPFRVIFEIRLNYKFTQETRTGIQVSVRTFFYHQIRLKKQSINVKKVNMNKNYHFMIKQLKDDILNLIIPKHVHF